MKLARLPLPLLLASLPLWASADTIPRAKMEFKVKDYSVPLTDFNFPSGLRVVFQEDHSQPLVSITAVNARGSTSDPVGKEGIAHVIEHLWFRSKHPDGQGGTLPKVWDLLKDMGAELNAFTTEDETVFMTVAPKANLVPLLRLEGLRMRDASAGVANDVLLVEREVVRNELRLNWEEKVSAVFGYLSVNLYPPTHPYGRVAYGTIGNDESLNAITLDDVHAFTKNNYGPQFTTIFVTGDIDVKEADKYLQEIGLDLMADPKNPTADIALVQPKARVTGPAPEPPPVYKPAQVKGELTGITKVRGAVDGPIAVLGWSIPGGWRDGDLVAETAANKLTIGISQEISSGWTYGKDAPIDGLGCGVQAHLQGSLAYCAIELKAGQDGVKYVDKALNGLYHAWENSEDEIVRKAQRSYFEYAKEQGMAAVLQQADLIASLFTTRVTQAAMYTHYTGDLQYFSHQIQTINALDPDTVTAFAQKYLNRERAVAVVMEPLKDGDVNLDSSDAGYRGASRESSLDTTLDVKDLTNDLIEKTVNAPDLTKLVDTKLPNGVRLLVLPYSNGPLLQSELYFKGGTESFPNNQGKFARSMITNDSYAIDPLRIAGFDGHSFNPFSTEYQIASSAGNPADALYTIRSRIDGLRADTNGRIGWIKDQKTDVLNWMDKPENWASHIRYERLLPGHSFSHWADHGEIDAMSGWGQDVSQKVWSNILRPENATLVMVGNIDPVEAQEAAKTYFGSWAGWHPDPKNKVDMKLAYEAPTTPPNRQVILFDQENASQTDVTYLCQLPPLTQDNIAAAQVMGDTLSEGAWMALREQTGASYGAYAGVQGQPGGGPAFMYMSSTVQNDQSVLAVKSFLGLGEKAKDGKLDPDLVTFQKYHRAQSYGLNQQSTEQMLTRIMSVLENGFGLEWFKQYPKKLASVAMKDIPPLVSDRCVGHEVLTLVGPTVVLKPMFDAANMPVEVFDWKKAKLDYATKWNLKDVLKAEADKEKEKAKEKKK